MLGGEKVSSSLQSSSSHSSDVVEVSVGNVLVREESVREMPVVEIASDVGKFV